MRPSTVEHEDALIGPGITDPKARGTFGGLRGVHHGTTDATSLEVPFPSSTNPALHEKTVRHERSRHGLAGRDEGAVCGSPQSLRNLNDFFILLPCTGLTIRA